MVMKLRTGHGVASMIRRPVVAAACGGSLRGGFGIGGWAGARCEAELGEALGG